MKRKRKRKKPGRWAWTQLELPDLDLAPLELGELGKIPELPEINLELPEIKLDDIEPINLELPDIHLEDIPEPDLDSIETNLTRGLDGLIEKQDREIDKLLGREGGRRQRRPRRANTPDK